MYWLIIFIGNCIGLKIYLEASWFPQNGFVCLFVLNSISTLVCVPFPPSWQLALVAGWCHEVEAQCLLCLPVSFQHKDSNPRHASRELPKEADALPSPFLSVLCFPQIPLPPSHQAPFGLVSLSATTRLNLSTVGGGGGGGALTLHFSITFHPFGSVNNKISNDTLIQAQGLCSVPF